MGAPPRLAPLLAQYDQAVDRLLRRMAGSTVDSGDGEFVAVPPLTDAEYLWEPVPHCWSVRRRTDPPGAGATARIGPGDWVRDGGRPRPYPPPFTTIAWRTTHLAEMLTVRADWTIGAHTLTNDRYPVHGDAIGAVAALTAGVAVWRDALVAADDDALDRVGHCTYPDGSDPDEPFLHVVWWVNQEILHHGAEIALLRDLYRADGLP